MACEVYTTPYEPATAPFVPRSVQATPVWPLLTFRTLHATCVPAAPKFCPPVTLKVFTPPVSAAPSVFGCFGEVYEAESALTLPACTTESFIVNAHALLFGAPALKTTHPCAPPPTLHLMNVPA